MTMLKLKTSSSLILAAIALTVSGSAFSVPASDLGGNRSESVLVAGGTISGNWNSEGMRVSTSQRGVAIGVNTYATIDATAVKPGATWYKENTWATAVGADARAWGYRSTAIGVKAVAGDINGSSGNVLENTTAVGYGSQASASSTTAIGSNTSVRQSGGVALGSGSELDASRDLTPREDKDVFVGKKTKLTFAVEDSRQGPVSIGSYYYGRSEGLGGHRQIKRVADGSEMSDAITVRQLIEVITPFDNSMASMEEKLDASAAKFDEAAVKLDAAAAQLVAAEAKVAASEVKVVASEAKLAESAAKLDASQAKFKIIEDSLIALEKRVKTIEGGPSK